MNVTMRTIAAETGVSLATVSRILSQKGSPQRRNKEVEKLVLDTAQKLGYEYQQTSKPIITTISNRKPKIGIILASDRENYSQSYFSEMLSHLRNEILESGYEVAYSISLLDLGELHLFQEVEENPVSGAVLLGQFTTATLEKLHENIPHIVFAGVNYTGGIIEEVICDAGKCCQEAIEHLISLGYKKIGYIGRTFYDDHYANGNLRYEHFEKTLKSHHLPINSSWNNCAVSSTKLAVEATLRLIDAQQLPEAFFCDTDVVAIGVLHACYLRHIQIPEDLAIVSVDDLEVSKYLCPPLTTVHIPKKSLSRLAISLLTDKITHNRTSNVRMDVPHKLMIRDSCGYYKK